MSGTTSLDDLPTGPPAGQQDAQVVNEIVSGIQQASMNGGLELPSRDVPTNTSNVVVALSSIHWLTRTGSTDNSSM